MTVTRAPAPSNTPLDGDCVALSMRIGARRVQQDAAQWSTQTHGDYLVAAVANGVGSVPHSEVIAEAATRAAIGFGAHPAYIDDPAHVIELTRTALPLIGGYADPETGVVFDAYEHGDTYGRHPDAALVVATVAPDGEVHAGWVGDCRAWLHLGDGRLIQLTHDHNPLWATHVLTRSLHSGGPENAHWYPNTHADFRSRHVLLTTDGVHDVLTVEQIRYALAHAPTVGRAACWLTRWAERAAGPFADNATALLVALPDHRYPPTVSHPIPPRHRSMGATAHRRKEPPMTNQERAQRIWRIEMKYGRAYVIDQFDTVACYDNREQAVAAIEADIATHGDCWAPTPDPEPTTPATEHDTTRHRSIRSTGSRTTAGSTSRSGPARPAGDWTPPASTVTPSKAPTNSNAPSATPTTARYAAAHPAGPNANGSRRGPRSRPGANYSTCSPPTTATPW